MADYDSQSDATDIVTIAIEMYDSLCDQQARVSEVYHSVKYLHLIIHLELVKRSVTEGCARPRCRFTSSISAPSNKDMPSFAPILPHSSWSPHADVSL
jgi:hypothetical protein